MKNKYLIENCKRLAQKAREHYEAAKNTYDEDERLQKTIMASVLSELTVELLKRGGADAQDFKRVTASLPEINKEEIQVTAAEREKLSVGVFRDGKWYVW